MAADSLASQAAGAHWHWLWWRLEDLHLYEQSVMSLVGRHLGGVSMFL